MAKRKPRPEVKITPAQATKFIQGMYDAGRNAWMFEDSSCCYQEAFRFFEKLFKTPLTKDMPYWAESTQKRAKIVVQERGRK